MMDTLVVEKRDQTGSSASRKMRKSGLVPAILYGHGQGNENLAITSKEVRALIRHNSKMVQLSGAAKDTALVSSLQWDALGIDVLHVDLIRVDMNQKVAVTVPVQLYGEPAGSKAGGMFLQAMHTVEISCPAGSIPESIRMDVSGLGVGDTCAAKDLDLPAGAELVTTAGTMVAQVEKPKGMKVQDEAEPAGEDAPAEEGAG